MVGTWPFEPYTFRALVKTLGPMWVRWDVCRRYARFAMRPDLRDADYRTKTFSCSRCGAEAFLCVVESVKEKGMDDYRLDDVEGPEHYPAAVDRLNGRHSRQVDFSGGELPGRKIDGRR